MPTPTIASQRTLYQRYKKKSDQQVWTCEYLGLTSHSEAQLAELAAWMVQNAAESLTMDGLIQHVHYRLYERRILIPAERTLRDLAQ